MKQLLIDNKYPFIGGPWDGEMCYVLNNGQRVLAPLLTQCQPLTPLPTQCQPIEITPQHQSRLETISYRMEKFRGNERIFPIYVAEDITVDEVMERLLRNYCKAK